MLDDELMKIAMPDMPRHDSNKNMSVGQWDVASGSPKCQIELRAGPRTVSAIAATIATATTAAIAAAS